MPALWFLLLALPILGGAERFNCRGRILGAYYADAKSGCKAFHVCVRVAGGGVRDFRFFCPPGTLFHQEAQTCTDWGDDDPLACPADLYDGQFDLYKIGSGYDTKKVSSQGNREEEPENNLQKAETGDRRTQGGHPSYDLRTAHSSDFFSGQRERGRDEYTPSSSSVATPRPQSAPRQSFRRVPTTRAPTTLDYTTATPTKATSQRQYDGTSKRKLVRKRPIYASTLAPTTYAQNSYSQSNFAQSTVQQQVFSSPQPQAFSSPQPAFSPQPQQLLPQNQNFNNRISPPTRPTTTTTLAPANVPPQYKDEYVEVPRVAPKQIKNRYYPNNPTSTPFASPSTAQSFNKKPGLVELYNYESQSTPGLNIQTGNRPLKIVKQSFTVEDVPRERDFFRTNNNANNRITPTVDYNTASSRGFTTTPAYRDFNSVSYSPDKTNYVFPLDKQNYYSGPASSKQTTTAQSTQRPIKSKLNTVAYNTNLALNTIQPSNGRNSNEDDGQYRLPEGEDDGQYRPELYERELLSGAHSLNIAASGNRLPEEQKKSQEKSQVFLKQVTGQTAVPRPFRPAPSSSPIPTQTTTTFSPEPTYTTTYRPTTTYSTQRTFDYFQTYTTTSRPGETSTEGAYTFAPSSTSAPRVPERTYYRAPPPPTAPPASTRSPSTARPPPRPQSHANPVSSKEDASYDYAYYDSDSGLSEFEHGVEEFEKTKEKIRT